MPNHCSIRTYRECSCTSNECRVQNIRVTKANDMRGVFTPKAKDGIALIAACMAVLAVVLFVDAVRHDGNAKPAQEVSVLWK